MHLVLVGLVVAARVALGMSAVTPSAPSGQVVFHFADPAIVEASALVVEDGLFLTSNDSGDTGRVFVVDRAGDTVGVTHWSRHPIDSEALAPAGPGHVWVGDIGDNLARRSSVTITRVPVGRGDRTVRGTSYRLTYPRGATDAETLLRDPVTGRLYLATKNLFGGLLYAVPEHLDPSRPNRVVRVGHVLPFATDGSFFPDGRHLIVRGYGSAEVYAWPSLRPIGSVAMPQERQGEGIAVADDGSVYVSSEGADSAVIRVALPPRIDAAVRAPAPTTPSPRAPADAPGSPVAGQDGGRSRDVWPWLGGGLFALLALVVLGFALRPVGRREDPPSGEGGDAPAD